MKRKIGVGLAIFLNLALVYGIIKGVILSYGLIVLPLGQDGGLKKANIITNDLLIKLIFVSILVLLVNYFLDKKMIESKKPFFMSLVITIIGIIIFIPFLVSARQSFLDYQNSTTQLYHYLDKRKIVEVQIITQTDTVQVKLLGDFINDIGYAKYKRGAWKYAKKIKIIFKQTDGNVGYITTNGQLFQYKDKYFFTDKNVIDKYLK